jgi:hypothetical protein
MLPVEQHSETSLSDAGPLGAPSAASAPSLPLPDAPAQRRNGQADRDYVDRGAALSRLPKLPFEAFLVVLMGTILLFVVFLNGRSALNQARQDRDAATAEAAGLEQRSSTAEQRLGAATAESDALARELSDLKQSGQLSLTERDDAITELESSNSELMTANETLEARIVELEQADPLATDEATEPTSGPAFDLFLGELLASRGGVRIAPDQSGCLGQFVIDDIGLEAIGSGLNTAKNTATNDVLTASMSRAAVSCGIDPVLIF